MTNKSARIYVNIFGDSVIQILKSGKHENVASFLCRGRKKLRIYFWCSLPYLKHDKKWFGHFWPKTAPSDSLVQRFLWKNRKSRIFEGLFQQDNDIVQMRDMTHSICLVKLCQITMRKNFNFLFLTALNFPEMRPLGTF